MTSAAQLRQLDVRQFVEQHLGARAPGALEPRRQAERERVPCGIEALDVLLGGGLPVGAITELTGVEGSGRTTVALACTTAMTRAGGVCAWVDVADALDPESVAAAGMPLERLLWVRCGGPVGARTAGVGEQGRSDSQALLPGEEGDPAPGRGAGQLSGPTSSSALRGRMGMAVGRSLPGGSCDSAHPRGEGRGLPEAISALMASGNGAPAIPSKRRDRRSGIGTPGVANRPVEDAGRDRFAAAQRDGNTGRTAVLLGEENANVDLSRSAPFSAEHARSATPPAASLSPGRAVAGSFPWRSEDRKEQANTDRQPARRGDNVRVAGRLATGQPGSGVNSHSMAELKEKAATSGAGGRPGVRSMDLAAVMAQVAAQVAAQELRQAPGGVARDDGRRGGRRASGPWAALDQALRATDLLLQAGGFSILVLDLGSTPAEAAWRIPLATWFRFRAACERTGVSLLLLTPYRCARSSAEVALRLEPGSLQSVRAGQPAGTGADEGSPAGGVMAGVSFCAERERLRGEASGEAWGNPAKLVPIRKPPQAERPGAWGACTPWALREAPVPRTPVPLATSREIEPGRAATSVEPAWPLRHIPANVEPWPELEPPARSGVVLPFATEAALSSRALPQDPGTTLEWQNEAQLEAQNGGQR